MILDNKTTRPIISQLGRSKLRKAVNKLQEHLPKLKKNKSYTTKNAATHRWPLRKLTADELYCKAVALGIKDFTPYESDKSKASRKKQLAKQRLVKQKLSKYRQSKVCKAYALKTKPLKKIAIGVSSKNGPKFDILIENLDQEEPNISVKIIENKKGLTN